MCTPKQTFFGLGFATFIKFSAFLSPKYSLWALKILVGQLAGLQPFLGEGSDFGGDFVEELIMDELTFLSPLIRHLIMVEPQRAVDAGAARNFTPDLSQLNPNSTPDSTGC